VLGVRRIGAESAGVRISGRWGATELHGSDSRKGVWAPFFPNPAYHSRRRRPFRRVGRYNGREQFDSMSKINWSRVLLCGLLTGIVWIILGAVVTAVLGRDFAALPNNHLGAPTPGFVLFNVVIDLLEGISILWLYAAIRPLYGPGAKAAIIAAFAWWFIVSLGDATWCSFGFFPPRDAIPLMIGTLPALILATIAGARLYRE